MDQSFNQHYKRFQRNIYNTAKGRLRLDVLNPDIQKILDQSASQKLRILDVGAGFGNLSLPLALKGHTVTLVDVSEKMIEGAIQASKQLGVFEKVSFNHCSLAQLTKMMESKFDLIICHAVLEWLPQAEESIKMLKSFLTKTGYLSLMFYNKNALIFKSVMQGNFFEDKTSFEFGKHNNLTPNYPLNPNDVYRWIRQNKLEVIDKTGVRIFYDYIDRSLKNDIDYARALKNELLFCKEEAFIPLARYIHVVCCPTEARVTR